MLDGRNQNAGSGRQQAGEALEREEIYASQREFMDSYRDDPSRPPETATAVSGLMLLDGFTGQHIFPDGGIEEVCGRFSEFETFAPHIPVVAGGETERKRGRRARLDGALPQACRRTDRRPHRRCCGPGRDRRPRRAADLCVTALKSPCQLP